MHAKPRLASVRKKPRRAAASHGAVLPPASYWRRLAPGLHVDDAQFASACVPLVLPDSRLAQLRLQLRRDGFFKLAPHEMPWSVSLTHMRRAVKRLVGRGWPASLLLMYDEVWAMAWQLSGVMQAVSGCVNALDTLAWMVTPALGQSGFAPHRDRQPTDVRASFRPDGTPKYCTAWVALSEASADTSCLYVVPRGVDPGYDAGDDHSAAAEDPLARVLKSDEAVQAVTACHLRPGGAVFFSHRVMHWGSRGRRDCERPRISVSFGCADPSFERPYFKKPAAHLPFPKPSLRAALVSAQLINYHERFEFSVSLLRCFGATFRAKRKMFATEYAEKTAAEFKAACEDSAARARAATASTASDDEEDAALDDALDAMLDAQRKSSSNLFDDFDEMEGS
ncbi:hypothetical protein AB1Y20_023482 [Prymnesium parvum]|uniref:Bifunctional lysine-specific demethylase and histidyl-hydroxylase n=1 Tax=Prymnesium parvum TaxID=97485 RepID=A0AB34JEM1_PRYPA